ncbi:tripartite motif-containing protein 16-like isoform X2 [Xyrauchen texanus]|uniref:tripartite motif-containing protein 16-like isoform X2 n=1 Tax=Xyrauchen texanus TaxID=154827 RepID=UPI002242C374|nr:tripartite motif-containing protein 16-like isoform X2 [Xyrauchen texanus]
MAEASISVAHEQFCCSICLDLLKDPVTIPCGHSYCMNCITDCWNQDDLKGVYSCPWCRQTFTTRPVLFKSTIVAEMVEKLKKTKLQTAVSAHCYAGAGDVECDVCSGRKHKAVKSCLECLNSYCQDHLEQHENLFRNKRHSLMDATGRLQEMICGQHNKLLEVFCRTDQKCICMLCTIDDHKNHNTVSAAAERTKKQSHLEETQKKSQQRIQESEKKMEELRRAVESHKRSAQTAVEDSERIFTELMRSIERRRSEVTQLIRDQEKAAVSRAEGLLERLEQEIADLRRRDTELEQLSHTHDHIQFLQSFQSFSAGSPVLPNITVSSLLTFDEVIKSVSQLKQQLEDFCGEHMEKISERVTYTEMITDEPKTRNELLQYCWNKDDLKGVYSCPWCRQTFTTRPALGKNVVFAEMVEKLKKTKLQTAVSAHCYAGAGDVECDVCTGRKHKAVKSCLECLNSYCQDHLEQHENFFRNKRHSLMDATGRLQEMICGQHNKLLEVFCRTDQKCICMLCTIDDHKNHDTVSASVERTKKQSHLEETQKKSQQRIQESEKKMEELRRAVESHKRSAQTAVEDSERIFTELMRSIERRRSEVTQLIRDQEKAAVSRAEGLLERLEQEIANLRRRDTELELLSHTHDHIQFLQSFQSFSAGSPVLPNITVSSLLTFDEVIKSVSQLKQQLEDFCGEHMEKISERVTDIEIATDEPKTRNEFLQYSCQLTVDLNAVNKHLRLSEENRVITYTDTLQQYPDHPDRFDFYPQVLCRESVCGRCYWEIEWSGSFGVFISVSFKSISRKGYSGKCGFGRNEQSWSLFCNNSSYSLRHNNIKTDLSVPSSCCRIGVYVDHSAGTLSFYSVSDTLTLIHRLHTTFTQPLYPGFLVNQGSTVKLSKVT